MAESDTEEQEDNVLEFDLDNVDEITRFLSSLDKPEKFYVFQEVVKGRTLSSISDDAGIATSTVHKYVERLYAAELIEKEGMGQTGYELTDKGFQVVNMLIALDYILSILNSDDLSIEEISNMFMEIEFSDKTKTLEMDMDFSSFRELLKNDLRHRDL
jgi:predicted transcriptional regulator